MRILLVRVRVLRVFRHRMGIAYDEVFANLFWQDKLDVITLLSSNFGHTFFDSNRLLSDFGHFDANILVLSMTGDLWNLEGLRGALLFRLR